jgi:ribosomal protein L19
MKIEIPAYTRYKVKIAYQLEDSFQKYTGTIIASNKE